MNDHQPAFDRPIFSSLSAQDELRSTNFLLQPACDFLVNRLIDLFWLVFDLD